MKTFSKRKLMLITLTGLVAGYSNAQASSSFNDQAQISFSVDTISPDLEISGLFEQGAAENGLTDGDGAVLFSLPSAVPAVASGVYQFDTFSVSGSGSNGSIYGTSYTGWYSLSFVNHGATAIAVDLTLNYALTASVSGQYASSNVNMDYYLGNNYPDNVYLISSVYESLNVTNNDSKVISLNIDSGATQTFYVDVTLSGDLQASPVPLPAAAWSFLAGLLGLLGVKKRKPVVAD